MRRAFILVLDSVGIGAAADAAEFGDVGADTLGHIAEACAAGRADRAGLRAGPLKIPNFLRLGLGAAHHASTGRVVSGLAGGTPSAAFGYAVEKSRGKDTQSGHWEMAGLPVDFAWGYFPPDPPSFPPALIRSLIERAKLPGVLGDGAASGTEILDRLGAEHIATGKPIVYTSGDSVFQIAAHEESFGLTRLYEVCAIARELVDQYRIARVIARPFVGRPGSFRRTGNRKDLATPPHGKTLLDNLVAAGGTVISVGKVGDMFAGHGITRTVKADGNSALLDAVLHEAKTAPDRGIVFVNFVDFDTLFGHRRDVAGYAAALEAFDRRLPALETALAPGDVALMTADHGNDPTYRGTDHTREHVPVIAFGPASGPARPLGRREGFADLGQSVAAHLGLASLPHGVSFLPPGEGR